MNQISVIANDSFCTLKKLKPEFSVAFPESAMTVLKTLKSNSDVITTKPDKGNGVVLLNRDDYIRKMKDILSDTSKIRKINEDVYHLILKLEDKLNRVLRNLKEKLGQANYLYLFATGSSPGVLYGLPKVHKLGNPMRPIISSIKTFNYNLAKFIVPIISSTSKNEFSIDNAYTFLDELKHVDFSGVYMASLDVKSLFTSIPRRETIEIICDKLYENPLEIPIFNRIEFKSLLSLAASESIFLFNSEL
jgi:hypothetical protein